MMLDFSDHMKTCIFNVDKLLCPTNIIFLDKAPSLEAREAHRYQNNQLAQHLPRQGWGFARPVIPIYLSTYHLVNDILANNLGPEQGKIWVLTILQDSEAYFYRSCYSRAALYQILAVSVTDAISATPYLRRGHYPPMSTGLGSVLSAGRQGGWCPRGDGRHAISAPPLHLMGSVLTGRPDFIILFYRIKFTKYFFLSFLIMPLIEVCAQIENKNATLILKLGSNSRILSKARAGHEL